MEGTPFDFRTPTAIGARIDQDDEQLKFGNGYDHNWVINKPMGQLGLMARVYEPTTGRVLEVWSTEPGLQFYSGNFLDGKLTGKGGWVYQFRNGFCMEPQHYPDSPNQPNFPSVVLKPARFTGTPSSSSSQCRSRANRQRPVCGYMNTIDLSQFEVWLATGSQNLYGAEVLKKVAANSAQVGRALDGAPSIPVQVLVKPVVKTPAEATALCQAANASSDCIGLITWCHTFSPSKMWINGLKSLRKPLLHLHTQHNRDIPWSSIDMDFMNLNQAAHGDREHGFIMSRLRLDRKVVVGYWQDAAVQRRIGAWCRAAAAWHDWQGAKFCRFGDNMREVAVTEGDKVAAQVQFGYSVNGYGVGDLVKSVNAATDREVDRLLAEYDKRLRRGAQSPQDRLQAAILARRGPHRAGLARFPERRRLQGLHGYL